jgi:GDP-4-dehydro-6-deoxy-D-mannose reductase
VQPHSSRAQCIDGIDITDVCDALSRQPHPPQRAPEDLRIRLLYAFLVGIDHELDLLDQCQPVEQAANATIAVRDHRRPDSALLQRPQGRIDPRQGNAPKIRLGVVRLHDPEHGADSRVPQPCPAQKRFEIARDSAGVAVLAAGERFGPGIDGTPRRGFAVEQRRFGEAETQSGSDSDDVCVVDSDESAAGIEEDGFEIRGKQASAPIAHHHEVWQPAVVRVSITGASGFVGGHLVPRLEAEGFRVDASDRELDVTDLGALEERFAASRPEAIIHLAAQSSVAVSWREPLLTYRVNYVGTRTLLEAARRVVPKVRLLLVSTADLYGSSEPGGAPFEESSALRPRSPYARSKAAADLLGGAFADRGLHVIRVRPFNHTGPGQTDAFVLASFARQVAAIEAGASRAVMRVGNLDSVRDFLAIDDVVEAYVRLLDPAIAPGVYNVASGAGIRIGDALAGLCELAGVEPRVVVDPGFFRPTDVAIGRADRLRAATGWVPGVAFRELLRRLLDDWRARISAA